MSEITPDHIWKMMKDISICMLVTWDGERQRARPMAAIPRPDEHKIYFFTDVDSIKDDQIERFPIITVTFTDKSANDYVVVTGKAQVSNDRAKVKDLWSPMVKAWWDSPEDPDIRLIVLTPDDAEAWDAPGGVVAKIKMLTAAMTDGTPNMGDNSKVKL